jgi:NAD(P)-dependent dehydrogenase (short-subunit alcohol dehydrogenase family)
VAVNYASSPDKAQEVADEIAKAGGEAITIGCNVAKREELEALFKTVTDKWGGVDVLVNNAGARWARADARGCVHARCCNGAPGLCSVTLCMHARAHTRTAWRHHACATRARARHHQASRATAS